jgi:hypothetical protein
VIRLGQLSLVAAVLAVTAACGGTSGAKRGDLAAACKREQAALAEIKPVETLGDAAQALRAVIAVERRALVDVVASDARTGALPTQLRLALATSRRSLSSVVDSDPQQTMDPIRTGAPAARRAAEVAGSLVADLCRTAQA